MNNTASTNEQIIWTAQEADFGCDDSRHERHNHADGWLEQQARRMESKEAAAKLAAILER